MTRNRLASPAQCRAARALLGWTQAMLAERAGVARKTIAEFETEVRTLHYRTRRDIAAALVAAGIGFVAGDGARDGFGGPASWTGVVKASPQAAGDVSVVGSATAHRAPGPGQIDGGTNG